MEGAGVGHRHRRLVAGLGDHVDPNATGRRPPTGAGGIREFEGARPGAGDGHDTRAQLGVDLEWSDALHRRLQRELGIGFGRIGAGDVVAERLELDRLADDATHDVGLGPRLLHLRAGGVEDVDRDRPLGLAAVAVGHAIGDARRPGLHRRHKGDLAAPVDHRALADSDRGERIVLTVAPIRDDGHGETAPSDDRIGGGREILGALAQLRCGLDLRGDDPHGHLAEAALLGLAVVDLVVEGELGGIGPLGQGDVDGLPVRGDDGRDALHARRCHVTGIDGEDRPRDIGVVVEDVQLARATRADVEGVVDRLGRLIDQLVVDEVLVLLLGVVLLLGWRDERVPVVQLLGALVDVPERAVVEVVEDDRVTVDPEGHAFTGGDLVDVVDGPGGHRLTATTVRAVVDLALLGPCGMVATTEHGGARDQGPLDVTVGHVLDGHAASGCTSVERDEHTAHRAGHRDGVSGRTWELEGGTLRSARAHVRGETVWRLLGVEHVLLGVEGDPGAPDGRQVGVVRAEPGRHRRRLGEALRGHQQCDDLAGASGDRVDVAVDVDRDRRVRTHGGQRLGRRRDLPEIGDGLLGVDPLGPHLPRLRLDNGQRPTPQVDRGGVEDPRLGRGHRRSGRPRPRTAGLGVDRQELPTALGEPDDDRTVLDDVEAASFRHVGRHPGIELLDRGVEAAELRQGGRTDPDPGIVEPRLVGLLTGAGSRRPEESPDEGDDNGRREHARRALPRWPSHSKPPTVDDVCLRS